MPVSGLLEDSARPYICRLISLRRGLDLLPDPRRFACVAVLIVVMFHTFGVYFERRSLEAKEEINSQVAVVQNLLQPRNLWAHWNLISIATGVVGPVHDIPAGGMMIIRAVDGGPCLSNTPNKNTCQTD
jgi:hypothetical protein